MHKLLSTGLVIGLLAITTPCLAQSQAIDTFLKIPWSLGIYLFKTLSKDEQKTYYIEVTASGSDLESARQSAFRIAVERAVGVIVASETVAQTQRLKRDEIVTYASGFVTDYKLVDQTQINNRIWVKMQVWIKESHLRDRLLSQSQQAGFVEGGKISAQIETLQHSRQNGDKVLDLVLRDYPQRAFDIQLAPTQVLINNSRQFILQVPVTVTWSKNYIRSLKAAVNAVNQRPDCAKWAVYCSNLALGVYIDDDVAFFEDNFVLQLFYQHMIISAPAMELTVYNTAGRPVLRQVFTHPAIAQGSSSPVLVVDFHPATVKGYYKSRPQDRIMINNDLSLTFNLQMILDNVDIKNLDKVEVKMVRRNL